MAYFRKKLRYVSSPQEFIRLGDGVNRFNGAFDMKKSEAYTSLNTCSGKYPALSVRSGMAKDYTDVTGPINAIGIRNNEEVHILDGAVWKRWDTSLETPAWVNVATGLTSTPSKIFDFVRETDRLTILVNGTDRKYYDGTNVYDLWNKREGVAADWEWESPFVVDNKMYVKVVSTTAAERDAIGIYDIVNDEWSLGEVAPISEDKATADTTWVKQAVYGNTLFATVLEKHFENGVKQVETATCTTGAVTDSGNITVTVTADCMDNSPKAVVVAVTSGDSASDVAGKVRTALDGDEDVSAFFTISGADANVILTANTEAADDDTLDISVVDTDTTGVVFSASVDTVSGVAHDTIYRSQFLKYETQADEWTELLQPPDKTQDGSDNHDNNVVAMCPLVVDGVPKIYANLAPEDGVAPDSHMYIYDIKTNAWTEDTDSPTRYWRYAVPYSTTTRRNINVGTDNESTISRTTTKIYAFGGWVGNGGIYDANEKTWDTFNIVGTSSSSDMFVFGSKIYNLNSTTVEIYDPSSNSWDKDTGMTGFGPMALYVADYDNVILTRGTGNIVRFYHIGSEVFGDDELFEAPKTNLYTSDDYRLFTLDETKMRCSDIAIPTEWIYGDSDTITITSMVGEGKAITWYKNMIICWSDQTMHILMGDDTENFRWMEAIQAGCISARGHTINEGTLYFMDYNAVKSFTGGITREISQKVRNYLENINYTYKSLVCMGSDGKYVYISFPYLTSTTNNYTLVYDTQTDNWYPWNKGFNEFVRMGDYLYAIDSTGIWKLNSGTTDNGTAITWSHETGAWNEGVLRQQKAISDLYVLADLPSTSTLTISYSTTVDGNDWVTLYTFTGNANEQNTRVQVPTSVLQPINWYRLKFAGTGSCTIFYLEPHIRIKSR